MTKQIKIFLLFLFFFSTNVYAYEFYIGDPTPEGYHNLDVEFFGTGFKTNQYTNILPSIQAYYGISKNADIEILVTYLFHTPYIPGSLNQRGMSDTTLLSTYRLISESKYIPLVSIIPAYLIPTGNQNSSLGNGKPTFTLPVYAQKKWGAWKVVLGLGYTRNTAPLTLNYFFGGVRLGYDPTEKIRLGVELYRQGATANTQAIVDRFNNGGSVSTFILTADKFTLLNAGGEYQITKRLALQGSIGKNVDGAQVYSAYLGIDYNFI